MEKKQKRVLSYLNRQIIFVDYYFLWMAVHQIRCTFIFPNDKKMSFSSKTKFRLYKKSQICLQFHALSLSSIWAVEAKGMKQNIFHILCLMKNVAKTSYYYRHWRFVKRKQ